jgi:hypothetical protein
VAVDDPDPPLAVPWLVTLALLQADKNRVINPKKNSFFIFHPSFWVIFESNSCKIPGPKHRCTRGLKRRCPIGRGPNWSRTRRAGCTAPGHTPNGPSLLYAPPARWPNSRKALCRFAKAPSASDQPYRLLINP